MTLNLSRRTEKLSGVIVYTYTNRLIENNTTSGYDTVSGQMTRLKGDDRSRAEPMDQSHFDFT